MTDTTDRTGVDLPHPPPPPSDAPEGEVIRQSWFGLVALAAGTAALGVAAGWNWVVFILALVVMIFMHELGHYLTARLSGMKVTEFFIGFGPRIWSFHRGETEYGIKAIWLGAYVRIIGMSNLDEVDPAEEDRTYRSKSYPRRLLVAVAGSAMHFLMAIGLMVAVLSLDGEPIDREQAAFERDGWTLSTVSTDSAAAAAGLEPGDEIVAVDGVATTSFAEFGEQVMAAGGDEVTITYERDGRTRTTSTVIGERLTAEGAEGIVGLIERDRILAVEGLDLDRPPTYAEFADHVADRLGEPLEITIVQAGTEELGVLEAVVESTVDPAVATTGFFGVSPEYERTGLPLLEAVPRSVSLFADVTSDVVLTIPRLVTGGLDGAFDGFGTDTGGDGAAPVDTARETEVRRLDTSDPDENRLLSIYGVARIGASATEQGLTDALTLLFFVNIFIGVFNLIPLLPLDGGHVAVATYERIRSIGGREHRVDAAKLMPLTYAVVALLLFVGGIALVRDILDPITLN